MLFNSIVMVEAEILLVGMGRKELSHQFLADLDSSGKRELFEQAVQILIADAKAVQAPDQLVTLAENIYRLVDGTPELKKYLLGNAPDGKNLNVITSTKEAVKASEKEKKKSRQLAAGISQDLLELVEDEVPPKSDDREGLFKWLLTQLGVLKSE